MTTREIITYCQRKGKSYSREEIRLILDQIVRIVLENPNAQRGKIDPSTGMPPYLATTGGVYKYTTPSDCLRVVRVFREDLTGYRSQNYNSKISEYVFEGKVYYEIPLSKNVEATEGSLGYIIFRDNPGTTTNKYFLEYIEKSPSIESQNIDTLIPAKHHFGLVDGVLARMRDEEYGDKSAWAYWMERTLPKISSAMNVGAGYTVGYTPIQEENRHYSVNRYYGRY